MCDTGCSLGSVCWSLVSVAAIGSVVVLTVGSLFSPGPAVKELVSDVSATSVLGGDGIGSSFVLVASSALVAAVGLTSMVVHLS